MIVTVNVNPNIDKYIKLKQFVYGGLNRVLESRDDPTSKGINISGVLNTMGIQSVCTGFMYEENRNLVAERLCREGIGHDYIWQPGSMRVNLKVFDAEKEILTEINERGVPSKEEHIELLKSKILRYAQNQNIMAFTGSMPPKCPADLFAQLIETAKNKGVITILDAEGEVLEKGISKKPYAVKINKVELESFAGKKLNKEDELFEEALKITASGVHFLMVSLGAEGSVFTNGSEVFKARGIKIKAVSPTGSGDSMVAALIKGVLEHDAPEKILRSAAAASTATALCEGTQLMTAQLYNSLYKRVEIEKIKIL